MASLADGFTPRADAGLDLLSALGPGDTVVLIPPRDPPGLSDSWRAGTGKTQAAAFVAESLWQSQAIDLLVWVLATSRDSILTGLAQASAASAGPGPSGDAESDAARYLDWLGETGRRWLMVLDDLADPADLGGLWPRGAAGRVLVTTPNSAGVTGHRDLRQVPVGAFAPREAMSYLMTRLARHPDQRAGAADLIEDLACMPLALAQASAVIVASGQTCREYSGRFARRKEQVLAATRAEPSPAAVTWTLSLEHADLLTPGAAHQVLAQAALLDCHGIPGAVFASPGAPGSGGAGADDPGAGGAGAGDLGAGDPGAGDVAATAAALASLERTGLLVIDLGSTERTVRMSPAVKAAVQQAMPTPMRDQAAAVAARALLRAWPEQDTDPWLALALRSCAASLRRAAEVSLWTAGGYPVLLRAGQSLVSAGHPGLALEHWLDLAATSEGVLGPGDAATVTARWELASALSAAGRADEAISLYEGIADDRARIHGPDHADTLEARAALARALIAAGRGGDAMDLFSRIVGACDELPGPEHPGTLTALEGLAVACLDAGRFSEATRLMERMLAARERLMGEQHPETVAARVKLAGAYCAAGQPREAVPHYQHAAADAERVLGPGHPDTIAVRDSLASARQQARQRRRARSRDQ